MELMQQQHLDALSTRTLHATQHTDAWLGLRDEGIVSQIRGMKDIC